MGEFNVNKSTGGLEQTAGMPSEYPATQVMLSDGVTSVEDALEDTGWTQIGTSGTYYRKIGNEVYVKGNVPSAATSSWSTIATLPEGYRPPLTLYKCLYASGNTAITNIVINIAGNIQYITPTATGVTSYYISFLID